MKIKLLGLFLSYFPAAFVFAELSEIENILGECRRIIAREEYSRVARELGLRLPLSSRQPSPEELESEAKRNLERQAALALPLPDIDHHISELRKTLPPLKVGEFFRYTPDLSLRGWFQEKHRRFKCL